MLPHKAINQHHFPIVFSARGWVHGIQFSPSLRQYQIARSVALCGGEAFWYY
ncbi:hypothetical protein [Rosenbergiella epipactidis]|uniref:hypothetical protein n=1 Tax=Rosenbergiella epipactidis TaxID=1544694 RepID=UPI001F4D5010|nr:hypothetical protein [Rosenbergiella epipactidis]